MKSAVLLFAKNPATMRNAEKNCHRIGAKQINAVPHCNISSYKFNNVNNVPKKSSLLLQKNNLFCNARRFATTIQVNDENYENLVINSKKTVILDCKAE
jgi:hypothetical protein